MLSSLLATPTKSRPCCLVDTPPKLSGREPRAELREVLRAGLDWKPAEELLRKLSPHLQREAVVDLQRRWQPVLTEWLQQWDDDDSELEPEEPVSDEDVEADESPAKRAKRDVSKTKVPATLDDGYPTEGWPQGTRQGEIGFNATARRFLKNCTWKPPSLCEVDMLPQQRVVATLVHPSSPVHRLLADHNTGSGKTLVMIAALDNFFHDPRAKIAIFPKDVVVDNFYLGILEWPSRWRDYFCVRNRSLARIASGNDDWQSVQHSRWQIDMRNSRIEQAMRERGDSSLQKTLKELFVKSARETLEMKRAFFNGRIRSGFLESYWADADHDVHPPAAPLRAYRFTSAGGSAAEIDENSGMPRGCVFKIGFNPEEKEYNPYTGKVVVMDEAHHLTRPHMMYKEQLGNLRRYLGRASNLVLLAATGTMVEDSVKDPRALLDAVKGAGAPACDQGFLSTHHVRGASFPRQVPTQCADGEWNDAVEEDLVERVMLTGTSLVRYMYQAIKLKREGAGDSGSTLGNFANVYVYFGSVNHPSCKRAISLHTDTHAPKFAAVVKKVIECRALREKCVVHCGKRAGYKALLALLEEAGDTHDFSVTELDSRADFNTKQNNRGQRYICMVADADAGSESIEFKCVRHHILVDVPDKHSDYIQRCGRSVRTNSHVDVAEAEREVRFKILCAVLPQFAESEVGTFVLFALCGLWGGPKKVNYNAEPEPSSIEEGAEEVAQLFECQGWTTLGLLRANADSAIELIEEDLDLEPKLEKRIIGGITAIRCDHDEFAKARNLESNTIDDRRLHKLRQQAARLAPAAATVRHYAVDAGFY